MQQAISGKTISGLILKTKNPVPHLKGTAFEVIASKYFSK